MSGKFPRITADDLIGVLKKLNFRLARQSGSHKIFKNEQGKRVTVPYHSGKTLHIKVLKNILKDANLTVEKLKDLL